MTTQTQKHKSRKGEQGNVLFLILIAVALFAALSYAVTQSTRTGGSDATSEKTLVSSAAMTQYPAALKTAIVRMIVSNSVDPDLLTFDPPSNFAAYDDSTVPKSKKNGVFYPDPGGGAAYQQAPADVMASGVPGTWHFNGENEVKNIGTSVASGTSSSTATADIIAFLPGISKAVCEKINKQLGITNAGVVVVPDLSAAGIDATSDMNIADPNIDGGGKVITTATYIDGQPQACYQSGASAYTYYHVLVER